MPDPSAKQLLIDLRTNYAKLIVNQSPTYARTFDELGAIWKDTLRQSGIDVEDDNTHVIAAATLAFANGLQESDAAANLGFSSTPLFLLAVIGSTLPPMDLPPLD